LKRNILTVFLASPGDLQEERNIAREVVDRVNRVTGRRVDWHIELLGWEDTLPGHGRPQSLINKDVDSCDLFLGALWRRWGQPTGEYGSGFEEEFTRALKRLRNTGEPEIWLFFKAVDEYSAEDPGEQLTKVLQFKNDQVQRKELLFREFEDPQQWWSLIDDCLTGYVLDIALKRPEPVTVEQSSAVETAEVGMSIGEAQYLEGRESYPEELVDLFKTLDRQVAKEGPSVLGFPDRARLFLLTSAWFSQVHLREILGVHETNIAYRYRRDWELSPEERGLLQRSLIGDTHDVRPGWYWVRDQEDEAIDDWILVIAILDSEAAVRRGAFSLLADIGYPAPRPVLENGLNDKDDDVVLQAIRLLRASGQTANLDLLSPLVSSDKWQVRDAAVAAQIEMLYLEDPNHAFSELVSREVEVPPLLSIAASEMNLKVDKELLLQTLDGAEASVRSFAARYLRRAKMLPKEICEKLLDDTHADVRKEGLFGLIELGEDVSTELAKEVLPKASSAVDEVISLILRRRDADDLLSSLGWHQLNGDDSYRVLATEHFELLEPRIRSDLDHEFRTLRSESEEQLRAKLGEAAADLIIQGWNKVGNFMKSEYISAALAGLVQNGQPEDVRFARKFLGVTYHNIADPEAIRLLRRFGDPSDAEDLLRVASNTYGETKRLAAKTALKLSPGLEGVLPEMLEHNDKEIAAIAAQALLSVQSPQNIELAQRLLLSENAEIRLAGLSVLARHLNHSELEKTLDEYYGNRFYYYNVVTWLDRYLFAPSRYGEFFRNQLINMLVEDRVQEEDA
jgi:HEAT repeat protein